MNNNIIILQIIILCILACPFVVTCLKSIEEEQYGVIFASECEVCKLVTKEIQYKLASTFSSDVIETGYNIDGKNKKKTKYSKSELRLLETLESVCEGMLEYRVHKERKDSTRWEKSMSQTFKTLHGLVNKGVKVDLGIPYDLWDDPSAEVTELKTQCEKFLEDREDNINSWYFGDQTITVQEYVCPKVVKDVKCLNEPYGENIPKDEVNSQGKDEISDKYPKSKEDL